MVCAVGRGFTGEGGARDGKEELNFPVPMEQVLMGYGIFQIFVSYVDCITYLFLKCKNYIYFSIRSYGKKH